MSRRIGELDGLRALAIIAVFLRHTLQVPMAWMGVDLFFVLSGFLITGILLDAPKQSFRAYIAAFYARRMRRIVPPYLLILLTITLLFGTFWIRRWYLYFGLMNYVACFWHDPPNHALGGLWSLAVEEQFYFVWPLVVFFVSPRKLPRVLLALIVTASPAAWVGDSLGTAPGVQSRALVHLRWRALSYGLPCHGLTADLRMACA